MQNRLPSDDGDAKPPVGEAVPIARKQDPDTGPISTRMLSRATASIAAVSPVAALDPDDFLDAVAEKLADRVAKKNGNGSGGDGPPRKRFLGVGYADWAKILGGWIVAAVMVLGTWYVSVRDGLNDRPTRKETREVLIEGMKQHSLMPHPDAAKRLKTLEDGQIRIQQVLIRQEGIDKRQTEILQEIKGDVKHLRRPRRR